jgi:nuclease S1
MSTLPLPQMWAWGNEGHRAVAMVAQQILDAKTATSIRSIIGTLTLRDLATCADEVRQRERQSSFVLSTQCAQVFPNPPKGTGNWHFINLDISQTDPSDVQMDQICKNDCAVAKIISFLGVLGNAQASMVDRRQALAFIVHFVGDLHQPLHAAERGHDEGGNTLVVDFLPAPVGSRPQQGKSEKLHAVWDSGILDVIAADENVFVPLLNSQITLARQEKVPQSRDAWVHSWARESLDFARTVAYKGLNPPPPGTPMLDASYESKADPVVRGQIARAGFRLSVVLRQALQ